MPIDPQVIESSKPVPAWGMAEIAMEDYGQLPQVLQNLTNQGVRVMFPPMHVVTKLGQNKILIIGMQMVTPQPAPEIPPIKEH